MRISYLIFLSFLFILLLFSITTFINYRQSEKVNENSEYVAVSSSIIKSSNRFQRNIINMVSGLRGFLVTGENYFLQAYDSAVLENHNILRDLSSFFPDTSVQYKLVAEIKDLNTQWTTEFTNPLRQAKINAEASEKNEGYFNKLYKEKMFAREETELNVKLQQKIREFINLEYARRDVRQSILAASVQKTKIISFSLTTLSIVAGFFIVSFLAYRISRQILKMVDMADTIAAGNYEVYTPPKGNDEITRLAASLNRMARVLSHNISELKRKNMELDQFAHIVSHDMKAPLRGVDNVVSWIEEDHGAELSPKVTEYLQLIKGRVARGENLINGILTYARIGKEEQFKEEVQVHQLIEEILENFVINRGIKVNIASDLPVLYTQRFPLLQVFTNLISNAIKYHDKEKGIIDVYHYDHGLFYEFFVKDNGPGISSVYHNKIFVIFQTLQERDSFESTGVGLAIVKKILDSRNETINIESEPGNGTTFSFTWKKS